MFAQITTIRTPVGKMEQLRHIIAEEYLPEVRKREGFVSASLLIQIDDNEVAKLVMFWDSHAAIEKARNTGLLQFTVESLAASMPGLLIQRESYVVPTMLGNLVASV